jgi:hypothetical protein
LAFGKSTVYAPHGKYQFQVQQVLPVGEGLQALRLQKLKERLSAEGLFDRERKQPLPIHPQTIAVVASTLRGDGASCNPPKGAVTTFRNVLLYLKTSGCFDTPRFKDTEILE